MVPRFKGKPIQLGGVEYIVPPLSLGSLEVMQERIDAFEGNANDRSQVATVVDAAHMALRRNYPEMTREEVADLVDISNMNEVFLAVMNSSGVQEKPVEGEAPGN